MQTERTYANYGLGVIMTCLHGFISCHRCVWGGTLAVGRGVGGQGLYGNSVFSALFCCASEIARTKVQSI